MEREREGEEMCEWAWARYVSLFVSRETGLRWLYVVWGGLYVVWGLHGRST